jgi:AmmeMemoRadiSam system protein B/AmmeMemoRadiSam system protein A
MMVRPAALAGSFYAADPVALMADVDAYLRDALSSNAVVTSKRPKILVIPHAGYMYSGLVAAKAYTRLVSDVNTISRVVLISPAHREYFNGIALPDCLAFSTPLGTMAVDQLGVAVLGGLSDVHCNALAHEQEHALEVHLPFLQRVFKDLPPTRQPSIVPLIVGNISALVVSQVIERLWGNEQTLIIISTDLSHFHSYTQAMTMDSETCQKVLHYQTDISSVQACGANPLNAALHQARLRELQIEQLAYCNSGDTGGNSAQGRERVVGYASFAMYEDVNKPPQTSESSLLDIDQGNQLLALAKASLHRATGAPELPFPVQEDWLEVPRATFVTLSKEGRLRGCIGSLLARRSLGEDVLTNAQSAALSDTRFTPVTADEAMTLEIEVSVLSEPVPLSFANEAHALWQLQPFRDGVIFMCEEFGRQYHSTFLPMVWQQFPDPVQLMTQLKLKAGLSANYWSDSVKIYTYRVQAFGHSHA